MNIQVKVSLDNTCQIEYHDVREENPFVSTKFQRRTIHRHTFTNMYIKVIQNRWKTVYRICVGKFSQHEKVTYKLQPSFNSTTISYCFHCCSHNMQTCIHTHLSIDMSYIFEVCK